MTQCASKNANVTQCASKNANVTQCASENANMTHCVITLNNEKLNFVMEFFDTLFKDYDLSAIQIFVCVL